MIMAPVPLILSLLNCRKKGGGGCFVFILTLVLSLSSLFLFSLHRSSSSFSTTSTSSVDQHQQLPPPTATSTSNNNKKNNDDNEDHSSNRRFSLTIKVLAYNRITSLSRCLKSLANAQYPQQDNINLHIFLDHFSSPATATATKLLNQSHQILAFVDGFHWSFGQKMVHYRTTNVGLQSQWLEAWWPSSDLDDFAFIVEDDLELSPLYYKFLKSLLHTYYFNASNYHPSIYGASLQRPRFVPGKHGNKMKLDGEDRVFLYQLVGTWGQLLFPRPWKEFRLWYDAHKAKDMKPLLQGMVTTGWYKKMGERIWTPWFIKFIHSRGYFNLYTNFLHEKALSVSHRDAGVNYGKTAGPDSFLLERDSHDLDVMVMQPRSKLKWYDFCFRQVLPDRVVRNPDELGPVLQSQQKQETVILVSLLKVSHAVARNLICHFESLNIQNYILLGPKSEFLLDLARRGHPVLDMDQFLDSTEAHKLMKFPKPSVELIKEMLVMTYFVKKTLELGYNIWVIDGNFLPGRDALFIDSIEPGYDFFVGNTSNSFFARSSSFTKKNWDQNFVNQVVEPLKGKSLNSSNGKCFVHLVAKVLEQKGVKIKLLDETSFGVRIGFSNFKPSSLIDGKKMLFWSSEMGLDLVQEQLEQLGMWVIDSEFSCRAVVCHQS